MEKRVISDVLGDKPFVVLGRFDMLSGDHNQGVLEDYIISQFNALITGLVTDKYGDIVRCQEVRAPLRNQVIKKEDPIVNKWHRDAYSCISYTASCFLVLWSSEICTEIQVTNTDGSSAIIDNIDPGSIILINNLKCLHRTPQKYDPSRYPNRWFARWISAEIGRY